MDDNVALETIVTFLEGDLTAGALVAGGMADVGRKTRLAPAEYRRLVGRIGLNWHWVNQVRADDATLARRLADPGRRIHLLVRDGSVAGFFELMLLDREQVELDYIGLTAAMIGRGLGRPLLRAAIAEARLTGARRLLARTCTLDHPAALPLYLDCGFRVAGHQRDRVVPLSQSEKARLLA
ncbi:MAG: GNAT family N-acetyltransferase [Rhizobiaceae bacterium]|nr:GNAT family N-acetyltransferase [Rhizobiaceae bacterium]